MVTPVNVLLKGPSIPTPDWVQEEVIWIDFNKAIGGNPDFYPLTIKAAYVIGVIHNICQAVDYYLWALQKFYEKKEDRYLEYIWSSVRVIHDLDDKRKSKSGSFYTQKKPLTIAALDNSLPGI